MQWCHAFLQQTLVASNIKLEGTTNQSPELCCIWLFHLAWHACNHSMSKLAKQPQNKLINWFFF